MRESTALVYRAGLADGTSAPHLVYRRSFLSKTFVFALKGFIRLILRILFQLGVKGRENIPVSGPYLVCPNHLSDVDPLLLYSLLPEDTLYIAYERNFRKPPLSWIVRFGRVLLTTPGGKVPRCLVRAYQGLQDGLSVCLFPEGGRTTTGTLMEPRDGAAILSTQANVPIIPVLIEGSQNLLSRIRPGFRLCKILVTFGEPIYPKGRECAELLQAWKQSILRLQEETRQTWNGICGLEVRATNVLGQSRRRYRRFNHDF